MRALTGTCWLLNQTASSTCIIYANLWQRRSSLNYPPSLPFTLGTRPVDLCAADARIGSTHDPAISWFFFNYILFSFVFLCFFSVTHCFAFFTQETT